MRVLSSICIASGLIAGAAAFPGGAGSCNPGTSAILTPNLPHATNMQVGDAGESLAFFGLEVSLNGEVLDPATPKDFTTGEAHNIVITATGEAFRGFLARLDGSVDTTAALGPGDGDSFVHLATETCIAVNEVGGITHDNGARLDLTNVTGVLQLDEPADGLVLDVTVVIRNSVMDNVSQWYFSSYTLNAVAPPTAAPVATPTAPPTTPPPTSPASTTRFPTSPASTTRFPTSPASTTRFDSLVTGSALMGLVGVLASYILL